MTSQNQLQFETFSPMQVGRLRTVRTPGAFAESRHKFALLSARLPIAKLVLNLFANAEEACAR